MRAGPFPPFRIVDRQSAEAPEALLPPELSEPDHARIAIVREDDLRPDTQLVEYCGDAGHA